MLRSLLSCASIFVLLTSTFFSPAPVSASRCGEKLPETLLSLYRSSQFIYIGTFDRIEDGEITEDTAEYSVVPVKKSFSLSTSLKGETKKMLVLEESEYRYKGAATPGGKFELDGVSPEDVAAEATEPEESETAVSGETEPEESEAESEDDNELEPGDRVLLFLNKSEESGELELADYSDGLKKMTPERLAAYEPRIRELNEIFSKDEPSYSEIVAWIVRCAEDPQTRWEGTYELLRSFQRMEWLAERAKLTEQKSQTEEEDVDSERYEPPPPKKFDTGDENFAKELTEGQKLLLTNMMLSRERPKRNQGDRSDGTPGMNRGDRELIELVRRWGDWKVAINIFEQIRYDSSDPNLTADLMKSIASILGDSELSDVAEKYSEIQWQSEEDEIEAVEEESNAADTEQPVTDADIVIVKSADVDEPPSTNDVIEEINTSDTVEPHLTPPKNEPKKKTYGEVRSELIKEFLDRAERLIIEHDKADKNE